MAAKKTDAFNYDAAQTKGKKYLRKFQKPIRRLVIDLLN